MQVSGRSYSEVLLMPRQHTFDSSCMKRSQSQSTMHESRDDASEYNWSLIRHCCKDRKLPSCLVTSEQQHNASE